MDLPPQFQRPRLTADRTVSVLLQPKISRCPTPRPGVDHLRGQTLFKIEFPARVVGIRIASDFHVTANGRGPGPNQRDRVMTVLLIQHRAPEPPAAIAWPSEVFGFHPSCRLAAVPSPCPTP